MREVICNLNDVAATLIVGEPLQFGNLLLFPLRSRQHAINDLVPLPVAVQRGDAAISELNGNADVGFLRLGNRSARPLLAPMGLIIAALAQHRMLARTMIVMPRRAIKIPVFCVEADRWATNSAQEGAPSCFAAMFVRRAGTSGVKNGNQDDLQHRVWRSIDGVMSRTRAASRTCSLHEVTAKIMETRIIDMPNILLPPETMGVAVIENDRLLGGDIFGSPDLFAALSPGIIQGLTVDASVSRPTQKSSSSAEMQYVLRNLLMASKLDRHPMPKGCGHGFNFASDHLAGSAIFNDHNFIHCSFFRAA